MSDVLTVKQLCSRVERAISETFPREVWVEGVISSLKRSANGHVYFDLVDSSRELGSSAKQLVSVALFASAKQTVNRTLRRSGGDARMGDGIKVRIRGEVNYYPPQGRVQLIMSAIDPEYTLGQMALDRKRLLQELSESGLLAKNKKKKMPMLPLRVALLTSKGSAAYADFLTYIEESQYSFQVTVHDCRMQGLESVATIVSAVEGIDRNRFDVLVIVRGGGSKSDLVTFDHKEVAFSVANFPLPVIVGVGHEIDRSVVDEVAHTSVKTPTAAAALLVQLVQEAVSSLESVEQRFVQSVQNILDRSTVQLQNQTQIFLIRVQNVLKRSEDILHGLSADLESSSMKKLSSEEESIKNLQIRLQAVDPQETLKRGWSITRTADGDVITSADQVKAGEEIETTVQKGVFSSRISS